MNISPFLSLSRYNKRMCMHMCCHFVYAKYIRIFLGEDMKPYLQISVMASTDWPKCLDTFPTMRLSIKFVIGFKEQRLEAAISITIGFWFIRIIGLLGANGINTESLEQN